MPPTTKATASLATLAGNYRIDAHTVRHVVDRDRLTMRRGDGSPRTMAVSADPRLYVAGDDTDDFRIVRDLAGKVIALDDCADGMPPAQRQGRVPGS